MVEFKLPDVGEGMHEGEIINWFIEEGDEVKQDDPVLEVQTDKVNAELTAPTGGTIQKIFYPVGEVVEVGSVLFTIGDGAEKEAAPAQNETAPEQKAASAPAPAAPPVPDIGRALATPFVRQMARDENIDLEQVSGTGPAGRVTEADLRQYKEAPAEDKAPAPQQETPFSPVSGEKEKRIPMSGVRRAIANHMQKAVASIPHVTHTDELDMEELRTLRRRIQETLGESDVKMTFLPFFIKAVAVALREFEMLNASLDETADEIVLKKEYHIGIAADTPQGLLVPVIHHADQKTLTEIAREVRALAEAARNGTVTPQQMRGSTFTISNMGPIGSTTATPIINHPEAAILALHKMEPKMVVRDWEGVIRHCMNMSLSFDHRLIDGSTAVRFTNRIKQLIEQPNLLMLEMR
ncbi:dihydrolipoamide acetyltransferase family protein [Alkalicoccus urumqiensis]|uniref:Dihydrolipoamide acetyltransferase component of pyruvate dehydrogenase complex n=1 Tax=Alkalicoccus urumqiensis TaxID=1548213 RepID=A0A2P6ME30_ALKUR|nr:dihydrolipoamide acetyltransferase family protein [Alkalicoccus urumqiensis]PRO64524.1 2-oxo acid dehydrogenase subunit E2 [Alkalicoccus urumqiensis]